MINQAPPVRYTGSYWTLADAKCGDQPDWSGLSEWGLPVGGDRVANHTPTEHPCI